MRTPILVSGVLLLGVLGGAAGYAAGVYETSTLPQSFGAATPLGAITSPAEQLPVKTAEPSNVPAFTTSGLTFRQFTFTVQPDGEQPVRLSIRAPRGWQLTKSPQSPSEVKFLDPRKERGVRVESGFPPDLTTAQSRDQLLVDLQKSQPPENDLRIVSRTDGQVEANGRSRAVSTLIYTYIPNKTRRYVIVRWIATGGDDLATVEMSVTGLPQDAAGLASVLGEATRTVKRVG
jgi:hypothetical protein